MIQARIPARYRVIEEVGQGGMAVVYKAHDESLKREVAVKLLHPHLLAEADSKTRLEREAQAVAKLHHDNIVQIFDYSGSDAESSYIVTEFIDGQTLKQFMAVRKPPPPEVAALIAVEIGSALLHAHSLGIIHRDVKPDNVMVRKDGMLKLMDFGVAQIMDLERMTVTGQLLGSPAYMAPEILEGRPLDVRTDVFSVGIMLYQLATGALPFSGRNPHEVLKRIAEGKFADPRTINRRIADRLAKVIARALARKPDDRYATVAALVDDLVAFVTDAGLTEVRDELRQYFCSPDAYEKAINARMIEALVQNGKRAREGKQTARALELWNRALGMDPSNREVLGELKHAANRQHLERAAVAVVGAAALIASGFFIMRKAGEADPGPPAAQATAAGTRPSSAAPPSAIGKTAPSTNPAPTGDPAAGPPTAATGPENSSKPVRPRPPRPAARVPADLRTLTLVPLPTGVQISVDGQVLGWFGPQTREIELDLSREHTIEFINDECCERLVKTVGPDNIPEGNRVPARLYGKPAMLTVLTDPPEKGRVIYTETDPEPDQKKPVSGIGSIGAPISIPFGRDANMTKTFKLAIIPDDPGRPSKNHTVVLQAGARTKEKVMLGD